MRKRNEPDLANNTATMKQPTHGLHLKRVKNTGKDINTTYLNRFLPTKLHAVKVHLCNTELAIESNFTAFAVVPVP